MNDEMLFEEIINGEIVKSGQNGRTARLQSGKRAGGECVLRGCGIDSSSKTSLDIFFKVRKIDSQRPWERAYIEGMIMLRPQMGIVATGRALCGDYMPYSTQNVR